MTYVALNISHFMSEIWCCFPDFFHGLLATRIDGMESQIGDRRDCIDPIEVNVDILREFLFGAGRSIVA